MRITAKTSFFWVFLTMVWPTLWVMAQRNDPREEVTSALQRPRRQLFGHGQGQQPHIPILSHILPSSQWTESHVHRPLHSLFHPHSNNIDQFNNIDDNHNHHHGHHHGHNSGRHNMHHHHSHRPHRRNRFGNSNERHHHHH